jgi:glycosyltransferase involved in cell wall biosynthesis
MADQGLKSDNGASASRVSVIIPVHNGARTVPRALASVFAQTFTNYEVVVVNDGSTDDTASVLAGYGDRIRVISQPNRGLSAARNAGVRASTSEYIAFLDDDDEWMPAKLARCVPVLDADPECALVYTLALRVDTQGRQMDPPIAQPDGAESPTMKELLAHPWNVVPSQFVVRREVFERCGGFHERFVTSCEDLYFLLNARECGHFRRVPEPLLRKETRPLYPKALEREPECDLFVELVRERYGSSADGLIDGFRLSRVKVLRHLGHVLIGEGRPDDARRCLARVIHYQPASPKAYRRYLRTFLPMRATRRTSNTEDNEA